jgi:hypothetical protein
MYIIGIDPTQVSAGTAADPAVAQLGQLGFNVTSAGIKGYIYVKDSGSGITGDGYVALVDGSAFTAVMATTTTSAPGTGAGKAVGVARAAVTAGYYCWLQIYGPGTIRTSASCAAYTLINTTATAGQLDDDATAGAEVIDGIVLDTATGGAAAVTAGFIQWPRVGRTL